MLGVDVATAQGTRETRTETRHVSNVPSHVGESAVLRVNEFAPEDLLGSLNQFEKKHAPDQLFVAGDDGLLRSGRRVSVVGSRKASPEALRRTRKLVRELVRHGVTVTSGLAAGVDTAAHEEAIDRGGRTVAVLGTPMDRVYPRENADLYTEIVRAHAAVSQFSIGTATRRGHFPKRNRTMALLSDATVIVTATPKSGTFHQGWEALRLGRHLLIMESLMSSRIPEVTELVAYGAQVLNDANLNHWLDHLPERVLEFDIEL